MTTKRIRVEVPGDNTWTALDLSKALDKCPVEAKIRAESRPTHDPVIIIWWDEDL